MHPNVNTNQSMWAHHTKAEIDTEDIARLHSAVFSICGTLTDIAVVSNSLEIHQGKEYILSSFMKFTKSIVHHKLIANLRAGQNLNFHISVDSTFVTPDSSIPLAAADVHTHEHYP